MLQIETEYKDFVATRRRWKSDFELTLNKIKTNYTRVEALAKQCDAQFKVSETVTKLLCEVLMISHLMEKQDADDKQKIALYGLDET